MLLGQKKLLENIGLFSGSSKMSLSIFWLQHLTSKCTPAWPCRHDFAKIHLFGYFKSPKISRESRVIYFGQKAFFKIKGYLSVIGVVFSKMIFGYFKSKNSPKFTYNQFFKLWGFYVLDVLADLSVSTST